MSTQTNEAIEVGPSENLEKECTRAHTTRTRTTESRTRKKEDFAPNVSNWHDSTAATCNMSIYNIFVYLY